MESAGKGAAATRTDLLELDWAKLCREMSPLEAMRRLTALLLPAMASGEPGCSVLEWAEPAAGATPGLPTFRVLAAQTVLPRFNSFDSSDRSSAAIFGGCLFTVSRC
jgi:hypothetical protein